jgi:4-oxalocrotonate tautomerase
MIQVKLIEGVFNAAEKETIIEKLTDAMVSVEGEAMRPVTWVTIEEVASGEWGIGERPCTPATSSACAPQRSSRDRYSEGVWPQATGVTLAVDDFCRSRARSCTMTPLSPVSSEPPGFAVNRPEEVPGTRHPFRPSG